MAITVSSGFAKLAAQRGISLPSGSRVVTLRGRTQPTIEEAPVPVDSWVAKYGQTREQLIASSSAKMAAEMAAKYESIGRTDVASQLKDYSKIIEQTGSVAEAEKFIESKQIEVERIEREQQAQQRAEAAKGVITLQPQTLETKEKKSLLERFSARGVKEVYAAEEKGKSISLVEQQRLKESLEKVNRMFYKSQSELVAERYTQKPTFIESTLKTYGWLSTAPIIGAILPDYKYVSGIIPPKETWEGKTEIRKRNIFGIITEGLGMDIKRKEKELEGRKIGIEVEEMKEENRAKQEMIDKKAEEIFEQQKQKVVTSAEEEMKNPETQSRMNEEINLYLTDRKERYDDYIYGLNEKIKSGELSQEEARALDKDFQEEMNTETEKKWQDIQESEWDVIVKNKGSVAEKEFKTEIDTYAKEVEAKDLGYVGKMEEKMGFDINKEKLYLMSSMAENLGLRGPHNWLIEQGLLAEQKVGKFREEHKPEEYGFTEQEWLKQIYTPYLGLNPEEQQKMLKRQEIQKYQSQVLGSYTLAGALKSPEKTAAMFALGVGMGTLLPMAGAGLATRMVLGGSKIAGPLLMTGKVAGIALTGLYVGTTAYNIAKQPTTALKYTTLGSELAEFGGLYGGARFGLNILGGQQYVYKTRMLEKVYAYGKKAGFESENYQTLIKMLRAGYGPKAQFGISTIPTTGVKKATTKELAAIYDFMGKKGYRLTGSLAERGFLTQKQLKEIGPSGDIDIISTAKAGFKVKGGARNLVSFLESQGIKARVTESSGIGKMRTSVVKLPSGGKVTFHSWSFGQQTPAIGFEYFPTTQGIPVVGPQQQMLQKLGAFMMSYERGMKDVPHFKPLYETTISNIPVLKGGEKVAQIIEFNRLWGLSTSWSSEQMGLARMTFLERITYKGEKMVGKLIQPVKSFNKLVYEGMPSGTFLGGVSGYKYVQAGAYPIYKGKYVAPKIYTKHYETYVPTYKSYKPIYEVYKPTSPKYPYEKYPYEKYPYEKYPYEKYPYEKYPYEKYPYEKYPYEKYPFTNIGVPLPFIPLFPGGLLGGLGSEGGRGKKVTKQYKYTPSVQAVGEQIISPEKPMPKFGKMYTGQEFRPIVGKPIIEKKPTKIKQQKPSTPYIFKIPKETFKIPKHALKI